MPVLRILCDANVPAADAAFGRLGTVRMLPGRDITRASVMEADALVVRSVTPVDAALLEGTPVRFVGTATAGTDHVNVADLARLGVAFASAPGSNATSVVEYVLACLLALAADRTEALGGKTLGIVGVGNVGARLAPRARALGLDVVLCDPPRASVEGRGDFVTIEALLESSDVVTLHTPLTGPDESPWPTRGLLSAEALGRMRAGAWLVNAARGSTVDGPDLLDARARLGALVLDCWPGEPAPDLDLIAAADIATPHTAGYSFDGKIAGTAAIAEALRRHLESGGASVPAPWDATEALAEPEPLVVRASALAAPTAFLGALARQALDVRAQDARFRASLVGDAAHRAAAFADLRKTYPRRRENAAYAVTGHVPHALRHAVTQGLGMRIETPR